MVFDEWSSGFICLNEINGDQKEIIHLLKLIFLGYFPLRYENMLKCSMTIHFPLLLAILDGIKRNHINKLINNGMNGITQ